MGFYTGDTVACLLRLRRRWVQYGGVCWILLFFCGCGGILLLEKEAINKEFISVFQVIQIPSYPKSYNRCLPQFLDKFDLLSALYLRDASRL